MVNIFKSFATCLLASMFVAGCGGDEPVDPTPVTPVTPVNPPTPEKDTTAPTITVSKSTINIISGPSLTVSGNEIKIGNDLVASWKDDKSTSCTVVLTFMANDTSKAVNSGDKLSEEGKLRVKVSDEAGNSSEAEITLTKTDSQTPEIEVKIKEKNVVAGVKVNVDGNQLLFDDQVAAAWKDDYTENCKVELTLEGKTINSGDVLLEAGKLVIAVTDEFQNKATAEITLLAEAIYGLEGLQNLSLQVDKEVNLLQGISFADGVSLDKVEIEADGKRFVVTDPVHYVPDQSGTIAIIITVMAGERSLEFRVEGLVVKGLDYKAPEMKTVDLIREKYSWYNDLVNARKDFFHHHILISYVTSEWYKKDNLVYILACEVPKDIDCEDVCAEWGITEEYTSEHADRGYRIIDRLAPGSTIKAQSGWWTLLHNYLIQHPDKLFFISCAGYDSIGEDSREVLWNHEDYPFIKKIASQTNVILSLSMGNVGKTLFKTLNENEQEQDGGYYRSSSINSALNNKYTVSGYDPTIVNVFGEDLRSNRPVGFSTSTRNVVVPCTALELYNETQTGTTSSMPTATFSATLGNFLSILMSTHPGTTLEDASTIMREKYFREETFQYKDENDGSIKDGGEWYFFKTEEFILEEILHETEVKSALQTTPQSLPSAGGLYYEGKGIQFTVDGRTYDMTEENRSTLENAVQSGKGITWIYNSEQAQKYGVRGEDIISVKVMDRQARLIPDIFHQLQVR